MDEGIAHEQLTFKEYIDPFTGNGKDHWKPMHSRVAYYKKMGEILNSKDIFDPEAENYIGDLDFDDTSVHSALQCLERLSITVPKDYKKLVIDILKEDFNDMLGSNRRHKMSMI